MTRALALLASLGCLAFILPACGASGEESPSPLLYKLSDRTRANMDSMARIAYGKGIRRLSTVCTDDRDAKGFTCRQHGVAALPDGPNHGVCVRWTDVTRVSVRDGWAHIHVRATQPMFDAYLCHR